MSIDQLTTTQGFNGTGAAQSFAEVERDALALFEEGYELPEQEADELAIFETEFTGESYEVTPTEEALGQAGDALAALRAAGNEQVSLAGQCEQSIDYLEKMSSSFGNLISQFIRAQAQIDKAVATIKRLRSHTVAETATTKNKLKQGEDQLRVLEQYSIDLNQLMGERIALDTEIPNIESWLKDRKHKDQVLPDISAHNMATRSLGKAHIERRETKLEELKEERKRINDEISDLTEKISKVVEELVSDADTHITSTKAFTERRIDQSGQTLQQAQATIDQIGAEVSGNPELARAMFDAAINQTNQRAITK